MSYGHILVIYNFIGAALNSHGVKIVKPGY